MKINLTNCFEGYDLERVYQANLTKEFHLYKTQASGAQDIELLDFTNQPEKVRIAIKSLMQSEALAVEVPKPVLKLADSYGIAKLIGAESMVIVHSESWPVVTANGIHTPTGNFELAIEGVPVEIKGTSRLYAYDSGCKEDVAIHVDVKIPLIGSLVTNLFAKSLQRDFESNHEMALKFLSEEE